MLSCDETLPNYSNYDVSSLDVILINITLSLA